MGTRNPETAIVLALDVDEVHRFKNHEHHVYTKGRGRSNGCRLQMVLTGAVSRRGFRLASHHEGDDLVVLMLT